MTEFLFGKGLADRIRQVCASDEVDCAVAFWSAKVRDELFPRWGSQRVRIVCDISMGCNSRSSLVAYGASTDAGATPSHLWVHDGLHAKVYISDAGTVIGSANASPNGVGISRGEPGNLEAGTFHARGSPAWSAARAWFDELLRQSGTLPLDSIQLARAPERAHDPGPRIGTDGRRASSLLSLVRGYPDDFADVLFLSECDDLKATEYDAEAGRYRRAEANLEFEPADRTLIIRATHDYVPAVPPKVLMLWNPKRGRSWVLEGYSRVIPVRSEYYTTLWGVKHWGRFWHATGMKPARTPSEADRTFVRTIENGQWVKTATDLAHLLLAEKN